MLRVMDFFEREGAIQWVATRAEALRQWRAFLPKVGRYAGVRNQVVAGHGNVSRLSPAVRLRLITEDELVADTLGQYAFSTVEKWLQEVCWRRYWKGWLELRPGVWSDWKNRLAWQREHGATGLWRRAELVMAGRSGVAVMDGFARELVETGYLHNHARMWWASFWVHVERLPWELGAAFFFRHLLDADPASNTLSWRWVAGLQTPGKTYLVRRSNLERCMECLVDATGLERLEDGQVTAWVAEETADLAPSELPTALNEVGEIGQRVGLWLHEEDLSVEQSEALRGLRPIAVTAVWAAPESELLAGSPAQVAHVKAALADACARAADHYAVPVEVGSASDLVAHLRQWVVQAQIEVLVAMRPFVGPLGDQLAAIEAAMAELGVRLVWVRRKSDAMLLPLARRGFFPFWEKVRRELQVGKG